MHLLSVFLEILRVRWLWRGQILRLGRFDLMKQTRGAVFSWAWLVVRPLIYLFCFWAALGLGLRGAGVPREAGQPPYALWLCSGVIPWFFMQEMLGRGADLFRGYRHLVNRIPFPLPCITSLFASAAMSVQLLLCAILLLVYFACGMPADRYLVQVPILLALMLAFWDFASMLLSMLAAISRDLRFFVAALGTPLFWLSGVIFSVDALPFGLGRALKALNPITFFISGFRDALYDKTWCWADGPVALCFACVFAITVLSCCWVYARYNKELRDVL